MKLDLAEVNFSYEGIFLKEVSFKSGGEEYTHTYLEHDLEGRVISEALIGDLGQVYYETDSIRSPWYCEDRSYDQKRVSDLQGSYQSYYSFDSSDQIVEENETLYEYDGFGNRLDDKDPGCL